ncbi:MAG: chemotaxis protein CheW [Anaerolineae bacterium]|nr:chemotaxis protein CheW [Anaerolineae bacterium]
MKFHEQFSEIERAILEERARRAVGVVRDARQDESINVLIAELQSEAYAVPVAMLTAVYEDLSIVSVPCTPAFVSGVANIRGYILPVLDLGELLGIPYSAENQASALFVVTNENMTVALKVNRIGDIRSFAEDQLSPIPANFDLAQSVYIAGILPDDTPLLDLNILLSDPRLIVNETLS